MERREGRGGLSFAGAGENLRVQGERQAKEALTKPEGRGSRFSSARDVRRKKKTEKEMRCITSASTYESLESTTGRHNTTATAREGKGGEFWREMREGEDRERGGGAGGGD